MSDELTARVEQLRADFQAEKGYPFENFFCPFMHLDEPVPRCEGHIINEKFVMCNAWVPQRQDFDSFYGSKVEADYISAVQDRSKTALEKWIDPKLNRRYRPRLLSKGLPLEHYFTKDERSAPAQTPLGVVNTNGEMLCKIVIKKSPNEVKELHATDVQIVATPPDYFSAAIIASVLKAAHLTMFNLLGYRHVVIVHGPRVTLVQR